MKNIKYLTGICTLFIFFGCQKLDREIDTTLSRDIIDGVFANKSREIENLYSGLPDGMLYIDGGNSPAGMMSSATDEAEHTFESHPIQSFNNGSWNSTNKPDNVWNQYYRYIRLSNQAIVTLDKVDLDAFKNNPTPSGQLAYKNSLAEIRRWEYEARFLRAYYYFELVKRYGGVPLLTEALTLDTDFSAISRAPLQQCIDFIVSECEKAEPELPPYAALANYDNTFVGRRATKYAAMALKSRVLLYAASDLWNSPKAWAAGYARPELISVGGATTRALRWEAAATAAKRLIDTCTKYGAGLHNNYQQLFIANNFTQREVFLAKNTTASNTFERNNYPLGFPFGGGLTTPTQNLVDAHEVKIGTGTTATSVSFDWSNAAHVANIYNFSTTTATSVTRDPRLRFNVVTNGAANTAPVLPYGAQFGTPARFVQTFEGGIDKSPANATKTGYYLRKYIQEGLNLSNNNTGVHAWVLFRMAEAYLNYAEAANEYNPSDTKIAEYINLVRARNGVAMPPLPTSLSQDERRKRIRNERRVEFAFEDHRFWDLRRWMDETNLKAPIVGVQINGTNAANFVHTRKNVEERAFYSKMYLYPISFNEMNVGKGLVQNPGW